MVLHLRRSIIVWCLVLQFFVYLSYAHPPTTPAKSNEDNSSSEETAEDSKESVRQKRSVESPESGGDDRTKDKVGMQPRLGIPGLPDPATILKVAEILKTVGEQVLPILIGGMTNGDDGTSAFAERFGDSAQFLNRFKKDIEQFAKAACQTNG